MLRLDTSLLGKFCGEHARRLQISLGQRRAGYHFRRGAAGWSALNAADTLRASFFSQIFETRYKSQET